MAGAPPPRPPTTPPATQSAACRRGGRAPPRQRRGPSLPRPPLHACRGLTDAARRRQGRVRCSEGWLGCLRLRLALFSAKRRPLQQQPAIQINNGRSLKHVPREFGAGESAIGLPAHPQRADFATGVPPDVVDRQLFRGDSITEPAALPGFARGARTPRSLCLSVGRRGGLRCDGACLVVAMAAQRLAAAGSRADGCRSGAGQAGARAPRPCSGPPREE